jgi:uncharacterized protein (DUF302 family)
MQYGESMFGNSHRATHPIANNSLTAPLVVTMLRPERAVSREFCPMMVQGLTTHLSTFGPKDTANRVVSALKARGITLVARVDHAEAAAKVGMSLQPTLLLIFGNPKAGTPLIQAAQTIGIDLPLKLLVWQDSAGRTNLSYNDVEWLARRHNLGGDSARALAALGLSLADIAVEATDSQETHP